MEKVDKGTDTTVPLRLAKKGEIVHGCIWTRVELSQLERNDARHRREKASVMGTTRLPAAVSEHSCSDELSRATYYW
jgi:hypothetical protein